MQKQVLGRGLNAIFSEPALAKAGQAAKEGAQSDPPARESLGSAATANAPALEVTPDTPGFPLGIRAGRPVLEIPLERIRPNSRQPRRHFDPEKLAELALSIAQEGVLQPILVTKRGEYYEIVAGERRFRASLEGGRKTIPAILTESNEREGLKLALVENLLREDLNPIEEAHAFRVMVAEFNWTQDEIAEYLGRDRSTISNTLRLLQLPGEVQEMVARGSLSAGHVRALIKLDEASCLELAGHIERRRLSVRQAERLAKARKQGSSRREQEGGTPDPVVARIQEKMQRHFGVPVKLHYRGGRGRLEVHYHSDGELERIMQVLQISLDGEG